MLVLSRKTGERIHIGDEIVVEIRRIAGNRVTLAMRAPRNVRILRGELERVAKEFEETADPPDPNDQVLHSGQEPVVITHQRIDPLDTLSGQDPGRDFVT